MAHSSELVQLLLMTNYPLFYDRYVVLKKKCYEKKCFLKKYSANL